MGWMPYTAEDGSQQLSPGYVAGDLRATSDATATGDADPGEMGTDSGQSSADPSTGAPEDSSSSSGGGQPDGSQTGQSEGTTFDVMFPKTSGMADDSPASA